VRSSAEWRFFGALWRADRRATTSWWALIAVRGILPAAFAVAMGVVVADVEAGRSATAGLLAIGATFIAMQALGPVHDVVSTNLGARVSQWLHDRLHDACDGPEGLAHLDHPDLADELSSARDFDLGLTAPPIIVCMPNIGGGFSALAGGLAQALLLAGYRWWAPLLVGGAWASTHRLLKPAAIWHGRTSPEVAEQQRRADYAYRLAVEAPAAKELRLFGLAPWVVGGFTSLRRRLLDQSWEERRLRFRPTWWAVVVVTLANGVFFWLLARDAIAGDVGVGAVVAFAQAAIGASALAFGEADWWWRTAAQPVPGVLDLAGKMAATGSLPPGDRPAAGMPASEIRFEGVRFRYPGGDHMVFDGFDLTIPAGRSLAIVGQNGAGKTTLAKLLCRMYDPDEGAVLVDGHDLRGLDLRSWRRRVAAVFQDFVRYELSLRDNVDPHGTAGDEIVAAALADARAEAVADLDVTLAKGYPGGTDLSGGQWQRVALARAVAAVRLGAGVVLLDEPTAQLDVRGEAEIFERLLTATSGCTTILISHRFSTVRRADRICVVEAGRVVELGSHDELMAAGGRYRTMFELQASRFEDPEATETLEGASG
jgi:ABC-type transport system involved in cytochrome bd biosynthesis fused ATPase/permease subunit